MNFLKKYPSEFIIALIGAILFSYISFRAFNLSITIDEVATSELHQFTYSQIMFGQRCFWSANNHVLNTILLKFFVSIFGYHDWVIRIPNVLSYLIYFGSCWWTVRNITSNRLFQIIGVIILNSDIYLIDFFSLCRGYGLANAFEMLSIASFTYVLKNKFHKGNILLFVSAALAVYSNFTWIPYYIGIAFVYWLMYFFNNKIIIDKSFILKIVNVLLISSCLILLCFKPISYLISTNEFKYGTSTLAESFSTFARNISYNGDEVKSYYYKIVIYVLLIISIIISIFSLKKKLLNDSMYFVLLLISIIVFGTFLQHSILGTMYPDGRKATMYLPLLYLLLFLVINFLKMYYEKAITFISLSLVIFFIFHFIKYKNLHYVREWWFDEYGKVVANFVASNTINNRNRLAVNRDMMSAIYFYNHYELNDKIETIININEVKNTDSIEYYYVMDANKNIVPINFKLMNAYQFDNLLFQKK